MPKIRIQRLQSELFRLMNTTVVGNLRDPRLDTVTFTSVTLTPDMQFLKVFFTCMEDEETNRDDVKRLLNRSVGFVKSQIADAHIMRTIPDIHFYHDDTSDRVSSLESIFDKIRREQEQKESDDE